MVIIIFTIVTRIRQLPINILEIIHFTIFNRDYTLTQVWPLILLFYGYKLIDGFIDGIVMIALNLFWVLFFFFLVLNQGILMLYVRFSLISVYGYIDFTIILLILLAMYIWSLGWELVIIGIKTNFFTKMKLGIKITIAKITKKQIVEEKKEDISPIPAIVPTEEKELKEKWINYKQESVLFEQDEAPLAASWSIARIEEKKTFTHFYIWDTLYFLFYGGIFALLTWAITERGGPTYNSTIGAFFFPLWFILIAAYKSGGHFLRAVIFFFVTINIQTLLYSSGFITAEGIFLLNYVIPISKYFFFNLSPYFNSQSGPFLLDFVSQIMGIYFLVMFLILVAYYLYRQFKGKKTIEILTSTKYLYLRRHQQFNTYDILFNIIFAWLWPFNLETYKILWEEFKYIRLKTKESLFWEYGRLSFDSAIKQIKKYRQSPMKFIIYGVIFLIVGGILLPNYVAIPIIAWAFRYFALASRQTKTDIKIIYHRRAAEGSAFILTTENVLQLHDVDDEIVGTIPSVQSYD
jgi:hypothetical protein